MHSDVALRLRGHFLLPSVLTEDGPLGTLDWTGQGSQLAPPEDHEPAERPFVVVVPPTALEAAGQARLLLYGHGLLRGACAEGCVEPGDAELMPHLAKALGVVQVATDWWGLSQAELVIALDAAQDFSRLARLTDKLVMGAVAPAALTRADTAATGGSTIVDSGRHGTPSPRSARRTGVPRWQRVRRAVFGRDGSIRTAARSSASRRRPGSSASGCWRRWARPEPVFASGTLPLPAAWVGWVAPPRRRQRRTGTTPSDERRHERRHRWALSGPRFPAVRVRRRTRPPIGVPRAAVRPRSSRRPNANDRRTGPRLGPLTRRVCRRAGPGCPGSGTGPRVGS